MLTIAVIVAWTAAAALLAAYVVAVAREITYVTLADGRRTERKIPLVYRLLLPFAGNFRGLAARPYFARQREEAARRILASGLEGLITADEFIALRFLMPIACGGAWTVTICLVGAAMPDSFVSENTVLLAVSGIALFYIEPALWLGKVMKRRHFEIMRALPFVLDLLTLSVEAGMDFMSALQRNCRRRRLDPLNEELIRMSHEIQVGMPRRVALRNMADRVRQPDLKSVAFALIQADELGVPVGSVLRIQSEQLRSRRFDLAEKLANEAPVKMLGPLMLCIFPAVFVVLLAPMLLQAAKNLF